MFFRTVSSATRTKSQQRLLMDNVAVFFPFSHYDSQDWFFCFAALLEYGRKDEAKYRTAVLVAGSMNEDSPTVLYSSIGYHSIPIAVNLISNAIMNRASPNLSNYHITTYNDPYLFNSVRILD